MHVSLTHMGAAGTGTYTCCRQASIVIIIIVNHQQQWPHLYASGGMLPYTTDTLTPAFSHACMCG
jgi:hypothetical protein